MTNEIQSHDQSTTQKFVYSGGDTANNNSRGNIYPERKCKTDRRIETLDLILLEDNLQNFGFNTSRHSSKLEI